MYWHSDYIKNWLYFLKLINNKEVILIENDDFRIIKEKNKNR